MRERGEKQQQAVLYERKRDTDVNTIKAGEHRSLAGEVAAPPPSAAYETEVREENAKFVQQLETAVQMTAVQEVGECEMYKEERGVLEEIKKIDGYDMEKFDTTDSSEK